MQPLTKAAKLILRFSQQKGPKDFKNIITSTDDVQPTIRKFNNVEQQKEVPNQVEYKKKDNYELRQGFKPASKPQEKQFQQNVQRQKQTSENIDSPQQSQYRQEQYNRQEQQTRQEYPSYQQPRQEQQKSEQQTNQFQSKKYDNRSIKNFDNRNKQGGFRESSNKDAPRDQRHQDKKQSQQQLNTNKKAEDRDFQQDKDFQLEFDLKEEKQLKQIESRSQQSQIKNENIMFEDFAFRSDGSPISFNNLSKEQQEKYKEIKEMMDTQFQSLLKQKQPPSEKFLVTDEKIKEVEEEAFTKLKQFEQKFNVLTPEEQAQQEHEEDLKLAEQHRDKGYLIQEVYANNQNRIQLPKEAIEALKRYETADPNDLQGGQYLEKYLKQAQMNTKDIHISGDLAQLQHYAGSGQFNKVHEFIEQSKNLTQELLTAYIDIIDNYQNVDNFNAFQKVLNKNQKLFQSLDQSYFVQVYEMIFRSKLAKQEMIEVLIWYFKYLKQLKYNNIGNFNIMLFENVIDAGVYKLNPQIYEKLPFAFNQYLGEYIDANRGKQITGFPSLRVILNIAIDQTIKGINKESLKFIQILRQLQQLSQDFIDLSDLARLIKFFTGKRNKLQQIVEIYEQINDKKFIFQLDVILTQYLRDGGIIQCTNNLEEYYKNIVDIQNVRKLEIISLFAHKIKNYGIIADIYFKLQNSSKYSKSQSSYIFQICINTVLEQDNSTNTSNAVMSLVNEANSKDVPLNDIFVTMNNMKAQIKDGKYQTAFLLFEKRVIAKTILQFQSNKVLRFLLKYLQNQYPEQLKPYTYFKLLEYAQTFVEQLNDRQLLQLFLDEKYDNQIFEAIIEDESIFQFQIKEKKRLIYEKIKNQLLNGDYNYQKLIGCEENDDLLLEREIFMNYEYYVDQERTKILNFRKQTRIAYIVNQIDPNYFDKKREEDIYKELFDTFSKEELEQNLMDNDTIEFPELEQVKKFQEFIRPHIMKTLPIDLNQDLDAEKDISPQLRQQETEKQSDVIFTKEELEELKHEIQYIEYENKLFDDKETQKQFIRDNIKWEQDEQNMNDAVDFKTEFITLKDTVIMPTSVEEDTIEEVIREYDDHDDDRLKYNPKQLFFFGKLENIEFWQMKHVYYCPYQYNDHFIFTDPSEFQNEIWDLVAWGIHNQEPMAIKLGEYYSNISGQRIPEYLNQAIGDFYKYQVGHKYSKLRQKWIEALKIVGKVDYNKVYHKTAENAFLTPQDREVAQWLDTQSIYKPHMRAVMWKDFNPNKYVRYGVTNLDLL